MTTTRSGRPIPWRPEPEEALHRRLPAAIAEVVDAAGDFWPGRHRRHVFDFRGGLRLVISRDDHGRPDGPTVHVSASLAPGSPLERRLTRVARRHGVAAASARLVDAAEDAFGRIASGRGVGPLELAGFSPGKGVPHWFEPGRAPDPAAWRMV